MIILDGKKTSGEIKDEIAFSVKEIVSNGLRPPHLAARCNNYWIVKTSFAPRSLGAW